MHSLLAEDVEEDAAVIVVVDAAEGNVAVQVVVA